MDNITHTLVGIGLAKTGLEKRLGRGTTWILALSSNLPDIDVLARFFLHKDTFLYRRMLTHSVFGVPLFAVLFTFLFRRIFKNLTWLQIFLLTMTGAALHVLFDLINSYGVVLFYPLSWRRYELAWVFIIDLILWGLLILPLLLTRGGKATGSEKIFRLSMSLVFVYVLMCGALRARAETVLTRTISEHKKRTPNFLYVFPEALGPHRFKGVVRFGGEYEMYQARPFSGSVTYMGNFGTVGETQSFAPLKEDPRVKELEWFFKAPVWRMATTVENGRAVVQLEAFDLRFFSSVLKMERPPFTFMVHPKAKEALEKPQ